MNMHILGVIIGREYTTRVKKKSFILLTFLVPLLFAALCLLPAFIMSSAKEGAKSIAVVDESGIVMPHFQSNEYAKYSDFSSMQPDSVKSLLGELGMEVMVHVSKIDSSTKSVSLESYSVKPLGLDITGNIENAVNDAVEKYRISSFEIENLGEILSEVKSDVHMTTYTLDSSGEEKITSSEVYMMVSMLLGMIIYMFIAMFCGTVMSSVIEEKTSRVVEILVSSVKATELLFGKIIGVAMVALTQFMMWIVLTSVIVTAAGGVIGFEKISTSAQMIGAGDSVTAMGLGSEVVPDLSSVSEDTTAMNAILGTLSGLNYTEIILAFVVFFVFGYLLYASLFAAIGSAVENEADTQQLSLPVTIPLILGFFISIYAFKAPDSGLVFWGSMIPFTSPIVMLARIPYGVPLWQLLLSVSLLIGTFVLCAWASAKIYRIGILMFGKKSSFKDLWKWLRQD